MIGLHSCSTPSSKRLSAYCLHYFSSRHCLICCPLVRPCTDILALHFVCCNHHACRWMQAGAYQPFFRSHAHHDRYALQSTIAIQSVRGNCDEMQLDGTAPLPVAAATVSCEYVVILQGRRGHSKHVVWCPFPQAAFSAALLPLCHCWLARQVTGHLSILKH